MKATIDASGARASASLGEPHPADHLADSASEDHDDSPTGDDGSEPPHAEPEVPASGGEVLITPQTNERAAQMAFGIQADPSAELDIAANGIVAHQAGQTAGLFPCSAAVPVEGVPASQQEGDPRSVPADIPAGEGNLDVAAASQKLLHAACEGLLPAELNSALTVLRKGLPYTQQMMVIDALTLFGSVTRLGTKIAGNKVTSYEVPTNLFVGTVGDSGCKKTPKVKAMFTKPTEGIALQYEDINALRLAAWERIPAAFRSKKKPFKVSHQVQEYSGPGLDDLLKAHEEEGLPLLAAVDEGARLLKQLSGNSGQTERLLELFDGGGNRCIKATVDRLYKSSHVSVHVSIQPAVLKELLAAREDHNGFWSRFLFYPLLSRPTQMPATHTEQEIKESEAARATLRRYADSIFDQEPRVYELDDAGVQRLSVYDYECQKHACTSDNPSLKAIKGKSAGKALRICCLYHLAWSVAEGRFDLTIPATRLEQAIELVELSDAYIAALQLEVISKPSRGYDNKLHKRIHALSLKADKPVSWSDLREKLASVEKRGVNVAMAKTIFEQLQQLGIGEISKGKRNAVLYRATAAYPD